jgi:glutamine cyclotransferase
MSDPRPDRDVDETLAAWMAQVAPQRAPTRVLERTFAETIKVRQLRAYPWTRITIGSSPRTMSRFGTQIAVVVLVGLALLAMAIGLVGGGQRQTPPPGASPTATLRPTPSPSVTAPLPAAIAVTPLAVVPVPGPVDLVASGPALWALTPGVLDRIDPVSNSVTGLVRLGPTTDLYNGIAANTAGLWATDADAALVYRVDPAALKVTAKISAGLSPKGVLATAEGVWVADVHGGAVLRLDPASNKVMAKITVGLAVSSGPNWLASGLGSIWVSVPNTNTIIRIDPVTNRIQATIPAPVIMTACGGFAIAADAVWTPTCAGATLMARIDPTTNTVVATVDIGGVAYNPTLINGAPWVSVDGGDATSGRLVRVNPATNTIDRVLVPGSAFGGGGDILLAAGSVWVVDGYHNAVIRLPTSAFAP